MASFKGSFRHALDAKGRVAIPARVRRSDDGAHDRFVLAPGLDRCVYAYPPDEWRVLEDRLRAMSFEKSSQRRYARLLLSRAADVALDKQGRVMVPAELLSYARITGEVLIVGALDHLELWSPEAFDAYEADGPSYEQVAESLF
jgi:MraZ protein